MDIGNFLQNLFNSGPQQQQPMQQQPAPGAGMPDSSILTQILGGQSPQVNVMQQAGIDPQQIEQAVQQQAVQQQAPQPIPQQVAPPKKRHSLVDILGGISDAVAEVGGAKPNYQSTMDAIQARDYAATDRERALAADNLAIGDKNNVRTGMAVRGLQAILRQNPQADIGTVWPLLAQQAGVDPSHVSQLSQIFASHPDAVEGIAEALNGHEGKYAKQINLARNAAGDLQAYQVDDAGNVHIVAMPDGFSPVEPLKVADSGGNLNVVGGSSGTIKRIIPKTEAPGKTADRKLRKYGIDVGSSDRRYVADTRPGPKGSTTSAGSATAAQSVIGKLGDLDKSIDALHTMNALTVPGGSVGTNIKNYVSATGAGQVAAGAVGTEAQNERTKIKGIAVSIMQDMKQALGLSARDLDTNQDVQRALSTINDPHASYEVMRAATKRLRDAFTLRLNAAKTAKTAAPSGGNNVIRFDAKGNRIK